MKEREVDEKTWSTLEGRIKGIRNVAESGSLYVSFETGRVTQPHPRQTGS